VSNFYPVYAGTRSKFSLFGERAAVEATVRNCETKLLYVADINVLTQGSVKKNYQLYPYFMVKICKAGLVSQQDKGLMHYKHLLT
jgi:hypothetical protein